MDLTEDLCNEYWGQLPIEKKRVLLEVARELERAENKHPNWPKDQVYAAAIVAEENGELGRACVQYVMENGALQPIRDEAIETAAMGIRLVLNLPK